MKRIITALNIILLASIFAIAQNKKDSRDVENVKTHETGRQRTVDSGDKSDRSKTTSAMNDVLLESGTNLDAKLISTLDVKKAYVGDEVVLKTTKSIKQNGDVVIPKGTKLIGRITEVQRKSKENRSSKISMVFESLESKNLSAPINASIISIAKAGSNVQAADLFGANAAGSSSSSTTRSSSGGGGGLLGGVGNTVGGVANTATSTVGGITNTAQNTVGGATNTVGRTVNGIQISQSLGVNAQGSSTLSAENKNLKLQKGTNFQLQLNESIQK